RGETTIHTERVNERHPDWMSAGAALVLDSDVLHAAKRGDPVSSYAVVHVDEVPELDDGRRPIRPVRHHLGITGFGVNAWTAGTAGELIINEHQEADPGEDEQDRNEELYIVTQGRAVFELDGERRDAPAGTLVFVRPRVKRVAYAEEPGTTVVSVGA